MDFSIKFDSLSDGRPEIAVGFGVFDGVHPGHRLIISCVAAMAAERGALPAAVTFVPHPRAVIPGMEAQAEIKVGVRRVIEYIIHPLVKSLDEAIREP